MAEIGRTLEFKFHIVFKGTAMIVLSKKYVTLTLKQKALTSFVIILQKIDYMKVYDAK